MVIEILPLPETVVDVHLEASEGRTSHCENRNHPNSSMRSPTPYETSSTTSGTSSL
jgi:hypothetical protein